MGHFRLIIYGCLIFGYPMMRTARLHLSCWRVAGILFVLLCLSLATGVLPVPAQEQPRTASELFQRAMDRTVRGEYPGAEQDFKTLLSVVPGHLPSRVGLGQVYESLGRMEEAFELYQEVLRLGPETQEAGIARIRMSQIGSSLVHVRLVALLLEQARNRLFLGDLPGVRQAVTAIHVMAPQNLVAFHLEGLAMTALGELEGARRSFEQALEVEPGYHVSRYELGLLAERQDRIQEAVLHYGKIVQDAPDSGDARNARKRLAQLGDAPEQARLVREILDRGEKALKAGETDEAQAAIDEILELVPEHVGARHAQGLIHLRAGRLNEALNVLSEALEIDPAFFHSRFLQGAIYELQGRSGEAMRSYRQMVPVTGDAVLRRQAQIRINTLVGILNEQTAREAGSGGEDIRLARIRFEEGTQAMQEEDFERAAEAFQEGILLSPSNPFFYFNLGLARANQNKLIEAALQFEKVIELRPDHALGYFWLGLIFIRSGDAAVQGGQLPEAGEEYGKARDRFEKTIEYQGAEWAVQEAGKRISQLDDLRHAIEVSFGHLILAQVLQERGEKDLAISELEKAAVAMPTNPVPLLTLGEVYEAEGNLDLALSYYLKAFEMAPLNPAGRINTGLIYEKQGKIDEAIMEYEAARDLKPSAQAPHLLLGGIYFIEGRWEDSAGAYERALLLDDTNAGAHFYLGRIHDQADRDREALESYEKALELLDPDSEEAQYIETRKTSLKRFSGNFSHTFFSYDNNGNNSATDPSESILNQFSLFLRYVVWRDSDFHLFVPLRITVPLQLLSNHTSLTLRKEYFYSQTLKLTARAQWEDNTILWTDYATTFNYTASQGPSSLVYRWNLGLEKRNDWLERMRISVGLLTLDTLIQAGFDRVSITLGGEMSHYYEIGENSRIDLDYRLFASDAIGIDQSELRHTFSALYPMPNGDRVTLSYLISENQFSARVDQSRSSQQLTLEYLRPLKGEMKIIGGLQYTKSKFDVPRLVAGPEVASTIEKNATYGLHLGAIYPVGRGFTLTVDYWRRGNSSNLNIPRPPLDITEQLLQEQLEEQFRSLNNYQKHVISLNLSRSF